jgi:hypothetical protein
MALIWQNNDIFINRLLVWNQNILVYIWFTYELSKQLLCSDFNSGHTEGGTDNRRCNIIQPLHFFNGNFTTATTAWVKPQFQSAVMIMVLTKCNRQPAEPPTCDTA